MPGSLSDYQNAVEVRLTSGRHACLHLRPDIPFVLATGFSETVTPEKFRSTGIRELVAKPFNLFQIGEIITRVFKEEYRRSRKELEMTGQ